MKTNVLIGLGLVILVVAIGITTSAIFSRNNVQNPRIVSSKMGGYSMSPLFSDQDVIKIDTLVQKESLKRGDVVVFKINDPEYPSSTSVKRIVGLGGDRIKFDDGYIFLNDSRLNETYLSMQGLTKTDKFLKEGFEITVPVNTLFVLGDNRNSSYDSRMHGFVKSDDVIGLILSQ